MISGNWIDRLITWPGYRPPKITCKIKEVVEAQMQFDDETMAT